MLTKLLKYDMKKMFKFLSVFFILALFFSVLARVFSEIGDSLFCSILSSVASGTAISMMFSILINCLMRTWVTFRSNFYGDESYLTHTLPVSRSTLYLSKSITAYTAMLISFAVILASVSIIYLNKETALILKSFLKPITAFFEVDIYLFVFVLLLILFLEFVSVLQWGFMGIILGHRLSSQKILFSVLIGFLLYIVSQGTVLLVMLFSALVSPGFMEIFTSNDLFAMEPSVAKGIVLIATLCYLLFAVLGQLFNIRLFEKGVDVE